MSKVALVVLTCAHVALSAPSHAQTRVQWEPGRWVGAPIEQHVRLLQLTGVMPLASLMLRPTEFPPHFIAPDTAPWRSPFAPRYRERAQRADTGVVSVELYGPEVWSTYNSTVPYGINDGAMWAGRGVSGIVRAGARARVGPVALQIVPEHTWSKNNYVPLAPLDFNTTNVSPYANRFLSRDIDLPQRFGERALSRTDLGQSSLTVTKYGVKLGVSTENMWWGPGVDNALIMTNHAPGFVHTLVGTSRPVNIWLGKLEALHTVGWLKQSDYWRRAADPVAGIPADTFPIDRWLNGVALVFEPRGASGMYFGATRLFYTAERYRPITLREIASALFQGLQVAPMAARIPPKDSLRQDIRDQIASLWFRFVFPQIGFETYGELGRNDHPWTWRDFILEPDHARAYLFGMRKVFPLGAGLLSGHVEMTGLGRTRTMIFRVTPIWYTHHQIQQGYTNRGQVVGAGIGPGGDQQTLRMQWFHPRGMIGLMAERQQVASDALFKAYTTMGGFDRHHNVFTGIGPTFSFYAKGVDVSGTLLIQREYNRNFLLVDFPNTHFELKASYHP